jgi:hypothetical protein
VVVTAPDSHGRYYMIEIADMWDAAFAYAAGKKVGYKGANTPSSAPAGMESLAVLVLVVGRAVYVLT